jgi:hypothetical protein
MLQNVSFVLNKYKYTGEISGEEGRASKALLFFIGKRKFLMSYSVL